MANFDAFRTDYVPGKKYMVDGALINVLAGALNHLRPVGDIRSKTIKVVPGDSVMSLEVATDANVGGGTGGGGGGEGLPAGYTFTNFSICVNGSPSSAWWPTWPNNPEA